MSGPSSLRHARSALCARTVWVTASALVVATGCAPDPAPPGRLEVAVSPTPAAVGAAQVRVSVSDSAGDAVSGATVRVAATDPAGDPAEDLSARRVRPGLWVVERYPFDRAGEWRLLVEAVLDGGDTLRAEHPIRVVGGISGPAGPADGPDPTSSGPGGDGAP